MSFVSKEKIAPATWKVAAHIGAEDFRAKLDAVFAKELKKIALPGFRPGKAPRAMVERRYGEKFLFEEALDALLPGTVADALKDAEVEPQFNPEDLDIPKDQDWKADGIDLTFTVAARPEVSIENYKGMEVEAPSPAVTDADIDARILELRRRNARQVEVESRPAQNGDIALIDFRGLLDGEAFEGGTAQNHELTLGSGQFIPGFEEQVVGRSPGESFEVSVTFPEEYQAPNLAGKPVVFEVTLHELKAEELPEADDDFAQEAGGENCDTLDDLKAGIVKELAERKAKDAEEGFNHAVQDRLATTLEGEIPPAMFDKRTQQNIELFLERIQMPLERYLEIIGEDGEAFEARMREQSTAQIKIEQALQKIAELEGFEPSDDEIEAEFARLAEQYKVTIARVKYAVPEDDIVNDLNRTRALDFVKAEAVKTEV